jgi:succinate dehydrogenase flavin-adding protein (antitoxin of CptAB toxin-antitoxin module)
MTITIKKTVRDEIRDQCLSEIAFDRQAKQSKITNWWKNEDLYYSKKVNLLETERANVNLNEAQSFVTTFLSKINTPFNFKFIKGSEGDLKAARRANALKDKDAKLGRWSFKAMLARIQLIIYGRYVFEYHADSVGGYHSHLTNVDVYQFLIDPSCGGEDIEKAFHLGRGNIIKSRNDLEAGIKSGKYLRTETNELLDGDGNDDDESTEDRNAKNRWIALLFQNQRILKHKDQWKFWEWYTTYKGVRYYVLITEQGGQAVRIIPLKELFKSEKYPFFTNAAYPDLTEFWTPSPLDGVRDAIYAKSTSINQMIDNGEAINRPMKAFDVDAIKNPALLKYRKDGLIPVKGGTNVNEAIQFFPTVPITTAIQVYEKLEEVIGLNSGITAGAKGQADEKQVGIYEGNQQQITDRFALYSDTESDAIARFAGLYLDGLDEHLKTKVAIEMIGLDGVEWEEVSKKDLNRERDFDIMVITAGAEERQQTTEKKNKLTFLSAKSADQSGTYNKKIMAEMEAAIAGFSQDEIKAMTDIKDDENAELMSECADDIEELMEGKRVLPNEMANTAYLQKFRDYMKDNAEYFLKHPDIAQVMFAYMDALEPIVMRNMQESLDKQMMKEGLISTAGQANGLQPGQAIIPESPTAPAGDTKAVDQMTIASYANNGKA